MTLSFYAIETQIDFYLGGEKYAMRHSIHVPAIGDEVRFHGVAYKVEYRIWIYDEDRDRVAVAMVALEGDE